VCLLHIFSTSVRSATTCTHLLLHALPLFAPQGDREVTLLVLNTLRSLAPTLDTEAAQPLLLAMRCFTEDQEVVDVATDILTSSATADQAFMAAAVAGGWAGHLAEALQRFAERPATSRSLLTSLLAIARADLGAVEAVGDAAAASLTAALKASLGTPDPAPAVIGLIAELAGRSVALAEALAAGDAPLLLLITVLGGGADSAAREHPLAALALLATARGFRREAMLKADGLRVIASVMTTAGVCGRVVGVMRALAGPEGSEAAGLCSPEVAAALLRALEFAGEGDGEHTTHTLELLVRVCAGLGEEEVAGLPLSAAPLVRALRVCGRRRDLAVPVLRLLVRVAEGSSGEGWTAEAEAAVGEAMRAHADDAELQR
jgi:hypothetical protein